MLSMLQNTNAREEWSKTQCMSPKARMTFPEYVRLLDAIGKVVVLLPFIEPKFNQVKADQELAKFDEILDNDFDAGLVELSDGELALEELEQSLAGPPAWQGNLS